ncbi:hypothetical protein NMY22_g15805 [Coprinellus aureogranulatus]|nr:hypothetical protein NMY22_g15805 [Coprinellus aureogranulatus]
MDADELIGTTTATLVEAIHVARDWYCRMYKGGPPSINPALIHRAKFVTTETIENMFCFPQSPDDLPQAEIQEKLEALNAKRVTALGADRMRFYERYKGDVGQFAGKYTTYKQELDAEPDYKPTPALESGVTQLLQDIIKPLRALLLLLLAVSLPDNLALELDFGDLTHEPTSEVGPDRPDLIYKPKITVPPTATFEAKIPELAGSSTHWIHLGYDYVIREEHFSTRTIHTSKYQFTAKKGFTVLASQSSSGLKHVPSPGIPTPSRQISQDSLYMLVIQVMSYCTDCSMGMCVLTNLLYDHLLFRYKKTGIGHHFQMYLLSHTRPPTVDDDLEFFHFYLYLCDQFMMSRQVFKKLPDVRTDIPKGASVSSSTAEGRQGWILPSWVALIVAAFSTVAAIVKSISAPNLFTYMLATIQPRFIMDFVEGRNVLKYVLPWTMLPTNYACIPLVSRKHSRQAAILEHEDGCFVVKVHGDAEMFESEVWALSKLSGVSGVPKLLGTGSTVAGNKFIVMSNVGDALTEDVTDEEAQQIWDTVLKQVHQHGVHHHDLLYHNFTRDVDGSLCIIDFGDSAEACREGQSCPDRDWLTDHNVTQ